MRKVELKHLIHYHGVVEFALRFTQSTGDKQLDLAIYKLQKAKDDLVKMIKEKDLG